MDELRGRVAVITGAASGIGLAMAHRFGVGGLRVLAADIDERRLGDAVRALRGAGVDATGVPTDVSRPADNDELAAAADRLGGAHLVCLNAGVAPVAKDLPDLTLHDWEWVVGVNLWGAVHGTRAFLPRLLARDAGHIVYTASLASVLPPTNPYQVSKHAVHALAHATRAHLDKARSAVGVTVVYPGPVATDIAASEARRPERWRDGATDTAGRRRRDARMAEAKGMPPAEVAELVHDAVARRRFVVFTHPDRVPQTRAHLDRVAAEIEAAAADRAGRPR